MNFLSVKEAGALLGISTQTVRYLARHKRIPAGKLGRVWRFEKNDLENGVRSQYTKMLEVPDEPASGIPDGN